MLRNHPLEIKLKYSGKKYGTRNKEFNANAEWLKNEEARCNGLENKNGMK